VNPENHIEIESLEADRGEHLAYIRQVARRRADVKLEDYCWPDALGSGGVRQEDAAAR